MAFVAFSPLLVAAAEPIAARVDVPAWAEAGQPIAISVLLTNPAAGTVEVQMEWEVRTNPTWDSTPVPDPVHGLNHAQGRPSWTWVEDRLVEQGSLTDGLEFTAAETPWAADRYLEGWQVVDLGQVRPLRRVVYRAGDADWIWYVDVDVSPDSNRWERVVSAFHAHGRWGRVELPWPRPVPARWVRLRLHKQGQPMSVVRFPAELEPYDGTEDESWSWPEHGQRVAQGRQSFALGGQAGCRVHLTRELVLPTGAYAGWVRLRHGTTQFLCGRWLVLPPAPSPAGENSRFGINAADPGLVPWLRRLGVGWVRFENLKWPFVSPAPDVFRYDGSVGPWHVNHDALLQAYRQAGLQVMPFLFMVPDHASSAPPGTAPERRYFYPPRDDAAFAEFVFQTVARYGRCSHPAERLKTPDSRSGLNLVQVWEIWNEPNLTHPDWGAWVGSEERFFEMFRAAAEAIRRADPQARIASPGYAGISVNTVDSLRSHRYADGRCPLDWVDVLSVHAYTGRTPPEWAREDANAAVTHDVLLEEEFLRLAAWRDDHKPDLSLWLTETGYDSAGPFGTDERHQAAWLPRMLLVALAHGMDKVFVYREAGSRPSMHAASGLLRDDGSPKPAFLTYATLIRALRDVRGGAWRVPVSDTNVYVLLWTNTAPPFLTAWAIEEKPAGLPFELGACSVIDALGTERALFSTRDLALSIFPCYIRPKSWTAGLRQAVQAARQHAEQRKARDADRARRPAVVFNFGTETNRLFVRIGKERQTIAVPAQATFDPDRGYGWLDGSHRSDQHRPWIRVPLERTGCAVSAGSGFRWTVPAGRCRILLAAEPAAGGTVVIRAQGRDVSCSPRPDGRWEAEVEADGTLEIRLDRGGILWWLAAEGLP